MPQTVYSCFTNTFTVFLPSLHQQQIYIVTTHTPTKNVVKSRSFCILFPYNTCTKYSNIDYIMHTPLLYYKVPPPFFHKIFVNQMINCTCNYIYKTKIYFLISSTWFRRCFVQTSFHLFFRLFFTHFSSHYDYLVDTSW